MGRCLEVLEGLAAQGSIEVLKFFCSFLVENFEKMKKAEVIDDLERFLAKKPMASLERLKKKLEREWTVEAILIFLKSTEKSLERTADYAAKLLRGKVVLTLSNSVTLRDTFLKAKEISVFVQESLPGGEGKVLFESLRENGIEAFLIPDALCFRYLREVDACVIGADYVYPSGDVLNKVGSATLAVLCEHFRKPFLVVADPSKFGKRFPKETELFERVPSKLITAILTDPEGGTVC